MKSRLRSGAIGCHLAGETDCSIPLVTHPILWHLAGVVTRPSRQITRTLISGLLLGMLLLRAYVPVGFMPASGRPFEIEICSAALSMDMPAMPGMAHHHHSGSHSSLEVCPFGSAPSAGPISHIDFFSPAGPIKTDVFGVFTPFLLSARLERAHQPRGPPAHC
jgi:hypothetical protein